MHVIGTSEGTKFFDCRRHGYVCGAPDPAIENVTCSAEGDCECEKNSNYITVNNVCINRNGKSSHFVQLFCCVKNCLCRNINIIIIFISVTGVFEQGEMSLKV